MKVICKDFEVRGEIIADNCTFNVAVILDPTVVNRINETDGLFLILDIGVDGVRKPYAIKKSEVVSILTESEAEVTIAISPSSKLDIVKTVLTSIGVNMRVIE